MQNCIDIIGYGDYLKQTRRRLHEIPELCECEYQTCEYIYGELKSFGLKPRKVDTGVICDIIGEDKSRRIALRADMDGLAIKENTDVEFASKNGCMHACGHDGHMAIVLTMAKILSRVKPKVNVRLIFQYGEEGNGGADKMIQKGAIEGVDEIYAFHLNPMLEKGKLSSCTGTMFAGTVEFDVLIEGKSCHCAVREKGIDTVKALRLFLDESETFNEKYKSNTLFHVGKITSGVARNVVSDFTEILCSLRYYDAAHYEAIMMNVSNCLVEAEKRYQVKTRVRVNSVYPPLINSAVSLEKVKKMYEVEECLPQYTAEDFAFYLNKIEGCMLWLGVKDETNFYPLHSDKFNFDESVLLKGVSVMADLVL